MLHISCAASLMSDSRDLRKLEVPSAKVLPDALADRWGRSADARGMALAVHKERVHSCPDPVSVVGTIFSAPMRLR